MAGRTARGLHRAALSGLSAQGRPAAQGFEHAQFLQRRASSRQEPVGPRQFRAAASPSGAMAPDHPRLCRDPRGRAMAGANIVDAQIFTTTDALALDTISVSREFEHKRTKARRARGSRILRAGAARRVAPPDAGPRGPHHDLRARADRAPSNTSGPTASRWWVTGLDRTGLLFELTATLSPLNISFASAMPRPWRRGRVPISPALGHSPTRQAAAARA